MNIPTQTSRFSIRCAIRFAARISGLPAVLLSAATLAIAASTPAPLDQAAPAIASGAGVSLAVWQDSRSGAYSDIYGALLDGAGQVLDSFAIATAPGSQVRPAVACNGTDFFVVWADYRNGVTADVYGARVTAAGVVLDTAGFPICADAGNQLQPAVASDGQNYFVVWQGGGVSSIDIFGARVSATGAVLDPNGVIVSQATNNELNPAISGSPSGYLVVWQDYRSGTSYDIYGARVNTAGVALDPAGIAISTVAEDQLSPTVSADGTGFMVAWQDFRSGSQFDIYGARVSSAGTVGSPTAISTAANDQTNPRLAANGTSHLAVWADGRTGAKYAIYAARINSAGAVSDANGLLLNNTARDQYHPAAAASGAGFWVAWQDLRNGVTADIFGTRLAANGSVGDPAGVLLSFEASAPPQPQTPVITWPAPASIVYGTALSGAQLSASANVPGTFAYAPAAGTVLAAGSHTLSLVFSPDDPVAYTTAATRVTLAVGKQPLTVTANSAVRLYGAANPVFSGSLAGVVNNDAITATFTCAATAASAAGSYPVTPLLSDPNGRLANYTVTSANGTLTVNPAPLTIGADDKVKFADQPNPTLTVTYQGFVNADSAASLDTPVAISTSATTSSPAGTYPIVPSQAADANYAITFVNGTLTIKPVTRPVITWPAPAGIIYGTALNSTQLNATADVPGTFTYTPALGTVLMAGDNQTLSVTFTPNDTEVYTTATATVTLAVGKKPLTVTANSAARLYGAANPAFNGTLAGVVNDDSITASFNCAAAAASPAGSYAITPLLSDPNGRLVNYTVTAVNGTLTVNPAPLTIRAEDKTKMASQPNPPLTATYQGFVNGNTAASLTTPVSLTTTATASSPAGAYPIVPSGASSPNYAITLVTGTMTVTPATPVLLGLALQPSSASITVAQTRQFSAVATYSDGSSTTLNSGVTWASASTTVATVDADGLATGRAAGTTTISASFGGQSASTLITVTSGGTSSARTFANTSSITIRDNAPASVYPSVINVSGLSGAIAKVTVKLVGFTHKNPDDLDVLLVGPAGQKVLLMSDAGGSEDAKNLTLTFDDAVNTTMPDKDRLRTATYRPSNFGGGDILRAPAPAGPYATALSAFSGTNPNGGWQLFIIDDAGGDAGSLSGGWNVTITTTQTP